MKLHFEFFFDSSKMQSYKGHIMERKLLQAMDRAISNIRAWPVKELLLFHHNDTDGLTSGTILKTAFERSGFSVDRYSLEKPYPQVLEKIFQNEGKIIVFTDFAGKIAPMIASLNQKKNLVLIIDHHPAEPSMDESVINLDGDLFGLKGDRDISASATCYLFASLLDKKNKDLAHLGTLGAVGDGFLVDGKLCSVNRKCLIEAEKQHTMRVETTKTGETYFITLNNTEYPARQVCNSLDTLGGVGYYSGGTDKGVKICQYGFDTDNEQLVTRLDNIQKNIFDREIQLLTSGGLHTTEYLQWFNVEERFKPMGVKMIGVFCNIIKNMDFLDHSKYLAGFQTVQDEIPGFGHIAFNSTKISMRVSSELTGKIRAGEIPGLGSFLPEATLKIGGFADACHGLSAATTVKIGQETELISEIETVLKEI